MAISPWLTFEKLKELSTIVPTPATSEVVINLTPEDSIQDTLYELANTVSFNFVNEITINLAEGTYDEGRIYCPTFEKRGSGDPSTGITLRRYWVTISGANPATTIINGSFYHAVDTPYRFRDLTIEDNTTGSEFAFFADSASTLFLEGIINVQRTTTSGFYAAFRANNFSFLGRSGGLSITLSGSMSHFIYQQQQSVVNFSNITLDILDAVTPRSNFLRLEDDSFCDLVGVTYLNAANWNGGAWSCRTRSELDIGNFHPENLPGNPDNWTFGFNTNNPWSGGFCNGFNQKSLWDIGTGNTNVNLDSDQSRRRYWNFDYTVTGVKTFTLPINYPDFPFQFQFINNAASTQNILIDDGGGTILTLLPGELGTVVNRVGNSTPGTFNWLAYKITL